MTKKEFNISLEVLLARDKDYLLKECNRLFECGGIDPEEFENDYILPKIILAVALKNLSYQYYPLHKEGKAQAKNLENF